MPEISFSKTSILRIFSVNDAPFSKTVSALEPIVMDFWYAPARNSPFHALIMLDKSMATLQVLSVLETLP